MHTINKIYYLNSPKTTQGAASPKELINLTKMDFFGDHKLEMPPGADLGTWACSFSVMGIRVKQKRVLFRNLLSLDRNSR
jgi:hypothetical protein